MDAAADLDGDDIVVTGHVLEADHIVSLVSGHGGSVAPAQVDGDRAVAGGDIGGDLAEVVGVHQNIIHVGVIIVVDEDLLHALDPVLVVVIVLVVHHVAVVHGHLGGVHIQVVVVGHVGDGVVGVVGDHYVILGDDDRTQDLGVGGGGVPLDIDGHGAAQLVQASGDGKVHRTGAVGIAIGVLVVKVGDQDAGALVVEMAGGLQVGDLVGDDHALHLHGVELVFQQGLVGDRELGGTDDGAAGGVQHHIIADHVAVQSVVEHLGSVVTGQRGVGGGVGQVLVEADGVGPGVHVDLPVGAGVTLHSGVVAQGHQDHLGGLGHGHVAFGIEGAVTLAGDDAQGGAVLDVVLGPVAGSVGVGVGHRLTQHGVLAAVEDAADDGGHLSTADGVRGSIGAVVVAGDDAQGRQHGDSLFVDDVGAVAEIVSAHSRSADDHHGQNHDESQSQAESPLEVSHLEFLLLKFEFGAFFALFRAKWGPLEAYNAPYMVREVGKMKKKGRSHRDRP